MMSPTTAIQLTSEFGALALDLDLATGLPAGISLGDGQSIRLVSAVRLVTGGCEVVPPIGGLGFEDTVDLSEVHLVDGVPVASLDVDSRTFVLQAMVGDWAIEWQYRFQAEHPRLSLRARVTPPPDGVRTLRNLHLEVAVEVADTADWLLHAPGNRVRPDLPLPLLRRPFSVSPPAGLLGSSGLIALESIETPCSLVIWPFATSEISDVDVSPTGRGINVQFQTDLAGEPAPGASLTSGAIHFDRIGERWRSLLPQVPDWLETLGVQGPSDGAAWIPRARIFEVQVGYSVFARDWHYSPYPTAQDLLDDLDRIEALGFDTLQVMPRHPFPSYNVHEYDDVTASWGDEDILKALVRSCHDRGMRVIFDILLHGVVDKEAVRRAADAVRAGPYLARLGTATKPMYSGDREDSQIAYSRHLIDFEPYWSGGSPERHHLVDEHPEWFCRDSDGNIIGIYTKSFDNADPGWHDYFIEACVRLVDDVGIDGFRFDAPTYNYFSNWSPRAREHASVSMLGCLPLFRRLRRALKARRPDVMLYTEPSGALLRISMDINYNYDEQYLFSGLLDPHDDPDDQEALTARDLGRWMADRDATLPKHAITAHHIDSHDTFWWQLPGSKWMRELHGLDMARGLMTVFSLSGGAYMMFVGGEVGIEGPLSRALHLRDERPELASGLSDHAAFQQSDPAIYSVVRSREDAASLVIVNLAREPRVVVGRIAATVVGEGFDDAVRDVFGDAAIQVRRTGGDLELEMVLQPGDGTVIPLRG